MNIIGIIGLVVAFIGVALTGLGVFFIFKDGSATTSRSVFWTISGAVVLLLAFILMIVAVIFKRRDLTNKKQKVEKRIKVVKQRIVEEVQDQQMQQQEQARMMQRRQQEEERKRQLMVEEYIAAAKEGEEKAKPDFGYVHVPGNFTEGPQPEKKAAAETMEKIRKEMKQLQKEIAAQKEKSAQLEKAHAKEREKRKFNELKSKTLTQEMTKNMAEKTQQPQSQPSAGSFKPVAPQNSPILGQLINAGLNPDLINAVLQNIPQGNTTGSEPNVMSVAPSPIQPSTPYNSPAAFAPSSSISSIKPPVDQAPSAPVSFTPTSPASMAPAPPSTQPPAPPSAQPSQYQPSPLYDPNVGNPLSSSIGSSLTNASTSSQSTSSQNSVKVNPMEDTWQSQTWNSSPNASVKTSSFVAPSGNNSPMAPPVNVSPFVAPQVKDSPFVPSPVKMNLSQVQTGSLPAKPMAATPIPARQSPKRLGTNNTVMDLTNALGRAVETS